MDTGYRNTLQNTGHFIRYMIQDCITAYRDSEYMDKLQDSIKDMLQDTGYRIHAGLGRVPTF